MTERKCIVCIKVDVRDVYGCPDCVNRLLRVVTEIGDYWQVLPDCLEPVRGQTGRMQPGYGSKEPMRLSVSALLDPRSMPDEDDDVRSLPSSLAGLADAIAGERAEDRPEDALGYIHSTLRWCAGLEWFDDLSEDLRDLHRRAQGAAMDRPQKPLGSCLNVTCGGKVFWGGPGRPGKCSACQETYDGPRLLRLGVNEETAA